MGNFQDVPKTADKTTSVPKQSYFNKRNIIIALTLIIICLGGFFLYRYFLFDYLIYDQPFRTLKGHKRQISSISFSPDGQTIASGSRDTMVKLWDAASGNLKQNLDGHQDGVRSLSFSPDGRILASGSSDQTIQLHDTVNGKLLYVKSFGGDVIGLAFSPDGQLLAVASDALYILDSANGDLKFSISTNDFYALALAFSPDGKTLAGSVLDETKLWDTANGNLKQTFAKAADSARSLIFSPDGQTLVGSSFHGKIFIWEVADGKLKNTLNANSDKVPIALSPNGKTLVSGGNEHSKETLRYDGEIEFWDLTTGNLIRKFAKQRETITSLSFSPTGRTLAAGNYDGTIGLWNLE